MNAIDILREHLRLLLSLYGPDAHGAGYLQGLIDAREATGNTAIEPGFMSTMQPATVAGYKYSAEKIFGAESLAVQHLQTLETVYGPEYQITLPEPTVAYRLGLMVTGQQGVEPIV